MNDGIKNLKGSKKRDEFKWAHKNRMNNAPFYASDADLCLVSFNPRGVVAYLDYKDSSDSVTKTEQVLYDEWVTRTPVYIVESDAPTEGPFKIYEYILGGKLNYKNHLKDWNEFTQWEAALRRQYRMNKISK